MKEYKTLYKQRWVQDRRTGRAPCLNILFRVTGGVVNFDSLTRTYINFR